MQQNQKGKTDRIDGGLKMKKEIILKTDNLCKSYFNGKNEHQILKGVSLVIYDGDFTVIMGSSGSGKSTLLYSISTMDAPTSGQVEFCGKDITALDEKEVCKIRNQDISFIFQSFNLLPDLTVFENITYPSYQYMKKEEVNSRAYALLKQFGLEEQANKFPSKLSGGQQQRVAITRALVSNPQIIFADEPTGALNSSAGQQVLNAMTDLNEKGQSIIMVTHDIKACARGNRLLFLSDGNIIGVLELGKYKKENEHEREEMVFKFLKEHNW